jgi:hypothetical protein
MIIAIERAGHNRSASAAQRICCSTGSFVTSDALSDDYRATWRQFSRHFIDENSMAIACELAPAQALWRPVADFRKMLRKIEQRHEW